jgi:hypothetical protein
MVVVFVEDGRGMESPEYRTPVIRHDIADPYLRAIALWGSLVSHLIPRSWQPMQISVGELIATFRVFHTQ